MIEMPVLSIKNPVDLRNEKAAKPQTDSSMSQTTIKLADLGIGNPARVCKLQGSSILMGRLRSMGVIPGTLIVKKSAIPAKGPIIVEKGVIQFAIGYDMAENILVEPVKKD